MKELNVIFRLNMEDIQHANFWDSRIPIENTPFKDLKEDTIEKRCSICGYDTIDRPGVESIPLNVKIDKDWFNNGSIILPTND